MEFTPGEHKSNVRSVDCCHGDDRIYSMRRNNICGTESVASESAEQEETIAPEGTTEQSTVGAKCGNRIR